MELELIDSWVLDKHSTIELYPQSSLNCPRWPWTVNDPPASCSQVTRFIGLHHHTHCLVCSFFFFFFYCFLPNLLSPGPSLCISLSCDLCFSLLFSFLPGPCIQLVLPLFLFFVFLACCASSDCFLSEFRLLVLRMSLAVLFPSTFFSMIFFLHSSAFFLTWDESWLLAQLPLSLRNSWVYKSVPPHQYLIKMDLSSSVYVMDFVVDVLSPGCCCLVFVRIYL